MDSIASQLPLSGSTQHVVREQKKTESGIKTATFSLLTERKTSKKNDEIFGNLISKGEVARLLDVSVSFIEKLMAEEGLPYFKIGRSVRFRLGEVEEWLLKRRFP